MALLAPFVVVGLFAKRILHAALSLPFEIESAAVIYGAVFCLALALAMGPYGAAQWVYDRYGIGGGPLDE